jgi:hypothetical protein
VSTGKDLFLRALLMLFVGLVFGVLMQGRAPAHDSNRPELNDWFMGLTNRDKSPCCDRSEATRVADPDWESRDGHYRVRLDNEWIDVPDNAVVEGANRDGRALVWPVKGYNGTWIRCFMPGAEG